MIQTMIFDFDGTLADSKQCSILATKEAFQILGLTVPTDQQIEYYMGIPIEKSFHEMAHEQLNEDIFEQLLITFRDAYKRFEATSLAPFEHIPTTIETLHHKGIQLFVLSSKKTAVLERNLNSLHIAHFFKEAIGSDKVTHYKPHPDGIFTILKKYNIDPSTAIMIGDATFDLEMGNAASIKTCGVSWGSHSKEQLRTENPTHILDNVQDLLTLIA